MSLVVKRMHSYIDNAGYVRLAILFSHWKLYIRTASLTKYACKINFVGHKVSAKLWTIKYHQRTLCLHVYPTPILPPLYTATHSPPSHDNKPNRSNDTLTICILYARAM